MATSPAKVSRIGRHQAGLVQNGVIRFRNPLKSSQRKGSPSSQFAATLTQIARLVKPDFLVRFSNPRVL